MTVKGQTGSRQDVHIKGVTASSTQRSHASNLPPFNRFQEQFRLAFGRELTREERRFYRLINIVLEEQAIYPSSPAPTLTFPASEIGTDIAGKSA